MKVIEASVSVSELKTKTMIEPTASQISVRNIIEVVQVNMKGEWDNGDGKFPISVYFSIPTGEASRKFHIGDQLHISILDDAEQFLRTI
jgi:hypothetical protein